jgi:hypothetical protein
MAERMNKMDLLMLSCTAFIVAKGCFFYFKEALLGADPPHSTHKGYKFMT